MIPGKRNQVLLTFPGGEEQKAKLLAAIAEHREKDRLSQRRYGAVCADGEFRGCAIGCMIYSLDSNADIDFGDYALLERFGSPRQIGGLIDIIFEGLPAAKAASWLNHFIEKLPVGIALLPVYNRFIAGILDHAEHGVIRFADERSHAAIKVVAELYRRVARGDKPSREEWNTAINVATDARSAAQAAQTASTPNPTRIAMEASAWAAWAAIRAARIAMDEADENARVVKDIAFASRLAIRTAYTNIDSAAAKAIVYDTYAKRLIIETQRSESDK